MALKFSTGLRNALLGSVASIVGTTLSITSGTKTIADSGNTLLSSGFRPGDVIAISGSGASNDGYYTVVAVASTGASLTVSESPAGNESANASLTITGMQRGFKSIFKDGIIDIYSGSQPTDADSAETGTKLLSITVSSGAFTKGTAANGIEFGAPAAGVLGKSGSEMWSGVGLVAGTAGWYRFYDNAYETGASSTAKRFDGACATSGAQINMSSLSIAVGATTTVDTFNVTQPAA